MWGARELKWRTFERVSYRFIDYYHFFRFPFFVRLIDEHVMHTHRQPNCMPNAYVSAWKHMWFLLIKSKPAREDWIFPLNERNDSDDVYFDYGTWLLPIAEYHSIQYFLGFFLFSIPSIFMRIFICNHFSDGIESDKVIKYWFYTKNHKIRSIH